MSRTTLSRYMRVQEVADELAISRTAAYDLLAPKGPIAVAPVTASGELRVIRASFLAYCDAADAEGARRATAS